MCKINVPECSEPLHCHCDVWSTVKALHTAIKPPLWCLWVSALGHLSASTDQHKSVRERGSSVIPTGPVWMTPKPLGFLHGAEYLCLGNRIKALKSCILHTRQYGSSFPYIWSNSPCKTDRHWHEQLQGLRLPRWLASALSSLSP